MSNIADKFEELGVIPVVVLNDSKDALPLAKALVEGGLPCAEVTFRTEAAHIALIILIPPAAVAGKNLTLVRPLLTA